MSKTIDGVNQSIRFNLSRKGMTQTQLAEKTKMSRCYISRRINGHRSWSIDDLDAIADLLDVGTAIDLIRQADSASPPQALAA